MKGALVFMFLLDTSWNEVQIGFLIGSLGLIVWGVFAFIKKMKRIAIRSFFSGNALLVALVMWLYNGNSEPAYLSMLPLPFQQVITSTDFDLNYSQKQVTFSNQHGLSGQVAYQDDLIILDVSSQIGAPESVIKLKEMTVTFTGSKKLTSEIERLLKNKMNKKITVSNGYIKLRGNFLAVHLQKEMAQQENGKDKH